MSANVDHSLCIRAYYFLLILLYFTFNSCSTGEDSIHNSQDSGLADGGTDPSVELFDPDHLIEVEIEMDPDDWDTIRGQGRSLTASMSGCGSAYEYTYVDATVTIDGQRFEKVMIRKKGYLGSISLTRPSLKLNFSKKVKGRKAWGMKRMTLNNDRQDGSHTHQCMSYQLFRDAYSVAPRCNFAHVSVNGKDLGIYSHVESIKKPFLARHFQDNEGNLYEGQMADFLPRMIDNFELKTNEEQPDRSDLDKAADAMDVKDEDLFESLQEVIDMDAFLSFWATEVITGHWDGYTGDQNNFYVYHDPSTDQFYFIPWGTDGAFDSQHNFLPSDIPTSVYAWSWLSYRLYSHSASRTKYHNRLKQLLDEVWDKEHLMSEVTRIGELTSADEALLNRQKDFVRTHKQRILEELEGDAPEWNYRPRVIVRGDLCLPTFNIKGEFETTWGNLSDDLALTEASSFEIEKNEEFDPDLIPLDLHVDEIGQPYSMMLVSAGADSGDISDLPPGTPEIWLVGVPSTPDSPYVVVILVFEPTLFGEKELSFHGFETVGVVLRSTGIDSSTNVTLGYISDGKVVFEEVGNNPGDSIKGSFSGKFVPTIFDQLNY